MLTELHGPPVVLVPAVRNELLYTGTLSSRQEQELGAELELGLAGVGAYYSVDATAGSIQSRDVVIRFGLDEGLKLDSERPRSYLESGLRRGLRACEKALK